MKSLNSLQLIGNLTHDPEAKTLPSGTPISTFSIAINRTWKDKDGNKQNQVDYYKITVFNKLAEIVEKYLKNAEKYTYKDTSQLINGQTKTATPELP